MDENYRKEERKKWRRKLIRVRVKRILGDFRMKLMKKMKLIKEWKIFVKLEIENEII